MGNKKDKKTKFSFFDITQPVKFLDAKSKTGKIQAIGQTVDQLNKNNRIYPKKVVEEAIKEAIEKLDSGQLFYLTGESDHPTDKGYWSPQFLETIINWTDIRLNGSYVEIEGKLLETSKGTDARIIMEAGILPGVSLRGWGDSYWIYPKDEEDESPPIQMVTELHYEGFDLVLQPADHQGAVKVLESVHSNKGDDIIISVPEEIINTLETEETSTESKTIKPNESNLKRKGNKKMDENVKKYIQLAVSNLQVSDAIKAQISKRVLEQAPETSQSAQDLIEAQVKELGEIMSELDNRAKESKEKADAAVSALLEATGANTPNEAVATIKAKDEKLDLLEAKERQREVTEFLAGEFTKLTWPEEIITGFRESVAKQKPQTIEEAKTAFSELKPTFDSMASKIALASKGWGTYKVSDVLEEETGYASYAKVSYRLAESLSRFNLGKIRDFRKVETGAEKFAANYLEMYDKQFQQQLMAESQKFSDTLIATDLNLPYSVMRAVIAEVFPILTAASVYDFGTGSGSSVRVYYEEHAGEAGMTGSVTDEATGLPTFSTINGILQTDWVPLANKRLLTGTVVVANHAATAILDDGTNFVVDHEKGWIKFMKGGSSNTAVVAATDFLVDYDYNVWRGLENAEIQTAKTVLQFVNLPMEADRLAVDITKESIVWSQQDLGYDVVARNLNNVIQQLRTKIDKDIHFLALNNLLTVQNNIVGTWNSGSDTPDDLADLIGRAKVAVTNRNYNPTRVVMSVSNADYLSNADAFNSAGSRADATLSSDGYIGRVKGLPVTETANFTDGYIKVVTSGLVSHRVSRGMIIEGPFPKYGANMKLIANDQYYVEEFNGTIVPIQEKGAVIKVV